MRHARPKAEDGTDRSPGSQPVNLGPALVLALAAVICFHVVSAPALPSVAQVCMIVYGIGLAQLARVSSAKSAFWLGFFVGLFCMAPQLIFFWSVFHQAAVVLWSILAFWIGLFVLLAQQTRVRWGLNATAVLLPFLWTGLEYFRSEICYLKFSWLNTAYALPAWEGNSLPWVGMYAVGFLVMIASIVSSPNRSNP